MSISMLECTLYGAADHRTVIGGTREGTGSMLGVSADDNTFLICVTVDGTQ